MRLVGARDLVFSAKLTECGSRVVIRIGPHRFTASRSEAVQLATEIVGAVDKLGEGSTLIGPGGGSPS